MTLIVAIEVSMIPMMGQHLPSILNEDMTILCRIIGKNSVLVSMYQQYYFRWNGMTETIFSVTNVADDHLTTRFVYPKDHSGEQ